DFIDLFEARGWAPQVRPAPSIDLGDGRMEFRQRASDAVVQGVSVAVSGAELNWSVMGAAAGQKVDLPTVPPADPSAGQPAQGSAVQAGIRIELQAGESRTLRVSVSLDNPLDRPPVGQM